MGKQPTGAEVGEDKKQCTIGLHVDDLKISHVDRKVVDQIIDMLDK